MLGQPVDPLPVYTPRNWQSDDEYPLYLINWKEASHTHARTQNNAWLVEIKPDNPLIIHPDTAAHYGIADGDQVWVESLYGRVKARVKASRRMHPEVVGLQHGFGNTALGGRPAIAAPRTRGCDRLRPTRCPDRPCTSRPVCASAKPETSHGRVRRRLSVRCGPHGE